MSKISRRSILKSSAAIAAAAAINPINSLVAAQSNRSHIAVIGAGAFGGWTALSLLRQGAQVTLLDAWGPGNSRASSGGETRVIRAVYGPSKIYTDMAVRALQLWKENEARWKRKLYTRTGALWMVVGEPDYENAAIPLLKGAGFEFEKLSPQDAVKRYPQINFDGVKWALLEHEAGYLLARQGCEAVLDSFISEGGQYKQAMVKPGPIESERLKCLELSDGNQLTTDQYVFACGPWLGKLFPDTIGNLIKPTRQDVFYFGTPAGDSRFDESQMPAWINHGTALFYGIPGNQWRGFKVADDSRGVDFDPTNGDRTPSAEALKAARAILALRFPDLKDAPLLESRVCQYENSPDTNFIIDRHPGASNTWIIGGGSGHGYKMGPALGEHVGAVVMNKKEPDPFFSLSRFKK